MTTHRLRPYARLLNMLGDQLIKNERIALIELIKNSYDADATWVKVSFNGFSSDFGVNPTSTIVIEDDGVGMSKDILENHWVNPATPVKWLAKKRVPRTERGRIIQGEKGIGRFALLKLGRKVTITTRTPSEPIERELCLDLSQYDEHLVLKDGQPIFLDDISVRIREIEPAQVIRSHQVTVGARSIERPSYGTRIEVSHLTGTWSREKVERVFLDVGRLHSILDILPEPTSEPKPDFEVAIYRNDILEPFITDYQSRLIELVADNAVLRVENGRFDSETNDFSFYLNGTPTSLNLLDTDLKGLGVFRRHFKKPLPDTVDVQCGPFAFAFYVFDFTPQAPGRFLLDAADREIIKQHRIYLYRDGIRVYPYGDPDDDWLQIDVARGTIRASEFLSNDQVVGFVQITQSGNPDLTDKTSREGLIDKGRPTEDFVFLLQLLLAWIRHRPYSEYRRQLSAAKDVEVFKKGLVQEAFTRALGAAAAGDPKVEGYVSEAEKLYRTERDYLVHRAETTEHLAGVGLSVETASHDLMLAMQRVLAVVDTLISETRRAGELDKGFVDRELTMVRGSLSFIQAQMKDLRLLFRSTKQRRKDIHVADVARKVLRLFQSALDKHAIEVELIETGTPLVAKTTDAVLLQVLLNLFDNALYWLQGDSAPRRIRIEFNGNDGAMVFSDSGPGIRREDAPYVFEPFYTGKGDDGRGLGLYIARQLLERHEYDIQLADLKSQRPLKGASFVISFTRDVDK